jgi:pimeloyl-ACP methyl ester carboxylesterase
VTARFYGIGRYFAGETDLTIVGPNYSSGGPLVIVVHGAGKQPSDYAPITMSRDLEFLAAAGCVVTVPDLAGPSTWGLDTVVHPTTGRIAAVRTWAAGAPYFADITRTALLGESMGAMNALGYHWRAPANVKCSALRIPVVAADALHDRDPGGLGALIDTAYGGGAAWDTAKPARDPSASAQITSISAFKDRVRCWYSTDDTTVLPADVTSFAAATGVRAIPVGAVGHAIAGIHARAQAEWIWSKLNS